MSASAKRRRRRRAAGGGGDQQGTAAGQGERSAAGHQSADSRSGTPSGSQQSGSQQSGSQQSGSQRRRRGGGGADQAPTPVEAVLMDGAEFDLDDETIAKRGGRSRNGKAVGRYQMNVHVDHHGDTHIATLEGRVLVDYYVSRPSDDVAEIHGNIYVGRVENVLPGMEAAFVDIGTPKNAVLYRGDVAFDPEDLTGTDKPDQARIEDILKPRQLIICQVTKNPIAHKGARLTQEVSIAGRFVVLVPNSKTYGISKRLPDSERKRLRQILDKAKPAEHGVIVRTAAENVTAPEIRRDVERLVEQWNQIEALAAKQQRPTLLYREPEAAVRMIREEFNSEYRSIAIDDPNLFQGVHDYVAAISPAMADRVEYYDNSVESLPLFERYGIVEQLTKALDRKVWLPSGGSLIIEHTEALTVIDVNTGRNVGSSSLEETVFKNNLEAAVEIARQLRVRDIGGIIVVDFVDMEIKANRDELVRVFKDALSRDKTRTQVYAVSDLGLVEMTRKRIGEGLLQSFSHNCERCDARGVVLEGRDLVGS
jgi:ribonuclease E